MSETFHETIHSYAYTSGSRSPSVKLPRSPPRTTVTTEVVQRGLRTLQLVMEWPKVQDNPEILENLQELASAVVGYQDHTQDLTNQLADSQAALANSQAALSESNAKFNTKFFEFAEDLMQTRRESKETIDKLMRIIASLEEEKNFGSQVGPRQLAPSDSVSRLQSSDSQSRRSPLAAMPPPSDVDVPSSSGVDVRVPPSTFRRSPLAAMPPPSDIGVPSSSAVDVPPSSNVSVSPLDPSGSSLQLPFNMQPPINLPFPPNMMQGSALPQPLQHPVGSEQVYSNLPAQCFSILDYLTKDDLQNWKYAKYEPSRARFSNIREEVVLWTEKLALSAREAEGKTGGSGSEATSSKRYKIANSSIRNTDGAPISSNTASAITHHARRIMEVLASGVPLTNKLQDIKHTPAWYGAIALLEAMYPILQLCDDHWKACHFLSAAMHKHTKKPTSAANDTSSSAGHVKRLASEVASEGTSSRKKTRTHGTRGRAGKAGGSSSDHSGTMKQ
ncbi:hypothetical protein PTI98_007194 [Pleurotus ostreatus]|nr:hypothetical protein PTI98_007194 [Pleurotus ostreatus]